MSTIQALYGAEHGSTAGLIIGNTTNRIFDAAVGTIGTDMQVLAAAAKNGSYGLRISGANNLLRWNTNTIGASRTTIVGSLWWRASTDPSGLKSIIGFDLAGGGNDYSALDYDPGADELQAWVGPGFQASTATISPNTWYLIEFKYTISGATNTFDWRIDGVAQTQRTDSHGADTFAAIYFGDASSGASGASDFDDIVLSITPADYPLGEHKVVVLSVDPAGTVTLSGTAGNFRTFSGSTPTLTAWNAATACGAVDEIPPNLGSSQDGWCQVTTAASDYVEMPLTSYTLTAGQRAVGARMLACCWAQDSTAATLGLRSYNGTTERTLFAAADPNTDNSTTAPAWVCKMLTPADFDTQAELDALAIRAGFSSDAAPDIGLHAVYVELAVLLGDFLSATASQASEADTSEAVAKSKATTLGQNTETDLAQAITTRKVLALGQATETDLAQVITGSLVAGDLVGDVLQTAETDAAQAATPAHLATPGETTETDLAQAVTTRRITTLGQVSETDSAQAVITRRIIAIGQTAETDLAQATTSRRIVALGQPAETETAQSITPARAAAVALVSETDTPSAPTSAKRLAAGQPSEVDTAEAVASTFAATVGLISETDLAQTITTRRIVALGQVSEAETAGAVTAAKSLAVGQSSEVDTASPTASNFAEEVGLASETDLAQLITPARAATANQASETDTAAALTASKRTSLSQAVEADLAEPLTVSRRLSVVEAEETDFAQALTAAKVRVVGQAEEVDESTEVVLRGFILVSRTIEADTAQPVTHGKLRNLGQVAETDTAQPVTAARLVPVGQCAETDDARPVIDVGFGAVGTVSEADLAQPVSRTKRTALADAASEVNSAGSCNAARGVTLGLAAEVGSAQALSSSKIQTLGQATETDTARGISQAVPALEQAAELDLALLIGVAKGHTIGQASEIDSPWIISSGPLASVYTDDLVQGCVKMLTAQSDVRAVLGSYGDTDVPWLFQHTLWVTVEGSGSTAAVVSRAGGWVGPNVHNTMRFPRLSVEIYVDPHRDGNRSVTDPGEAYRRAHATFRVLDRHLQIVGDADRFWGSIRVIGGTRMGEPVVSLVPDGGGLLRLQVFYGVVDAGMAVGLGG